ncbi:MAG: ACT domain-containing protein, partial [Bacteroidaceae bacterium]|nr:ACT domain-containing protein [Bacteroidaceae bacterium]
YASEIFVVTPKGDFKTMPADSTVLDFAFTIHTFLGTHCIGAKVNHKLEPISYVLQSGDQVEILTSKSQKVAKEWMDFVTTAKAKGKIQAVLRREEREKQKQGEEVLNTFLQERDLEPNSVNIDKIRSFHNLSTRDELFVALGGGVVTLGDADVAVLRGKNPDRTGWSRYLTFFKRHHNDSNTNSQEESVPLVIDKKKPLILNEETIGRYTLCSCCHPIPGDDVLGYFDGKTNITIHKRQCEIAAKLKASDGNHILAANWDTHKKLFFPATIHVNGIDHVGVLHQITGVLSQQLNVNIQHLNVDTHDGIFECEIRLGVHDVSDVQDICRDLKAIQEIEEVVRF